MENTRLSKKGTEETNRERRNEGKKARRKVEENRKKAGSEEITRERKRKRNRHGKKVERKERNTRVYPKVSGLAAWRENDKWYSSLPLGAVVSLFFSQSSEFCRHNYLCCFSIECLLLLLLLLLLLFYFVIDSVRKHLDTPLYKSNCAAL
jgi:hypothetical protein